MSVLTLSIQTVDTPFHIALTALILRQKAGLNPSSFSYQMKVGGLKLFELHLSLCEMETLFLYCIIIFRASLYPMEQEAIHLGRRIQKRETVNLPIFYCLAVPFEFLFSFRRDNGYDMDEKTGLKPSFKCAINNVRQVLE